MKFDLEKALAGHPVKLRNGTKAYVRHHETELSPSYPLQGYMKYRFNHLPVVWAKTGRYFSEPAIESDFDIVGMWVEPAVFNHWDALEPKWKYIAADEDGSICVFTAKPDKGNTCWCSAGFLYVTAFINFQYTDWEHSLVERPSKE